MNNILGLYLRGGGRGAKSRASNSLSLVWQIFSTSCVQVPVLGSVDAGATGPTNRSF